MGLYLFLFSSLLSLSLGATVITYDSISDAKIFASILGTNYVSQGFECCAVSEFGNAVVLVSQSALLSVDVMLSSWACQTGGWSTGDCVTTPGTTFTVPITLKLYDNAGAAPALFWSSGPVSFAVEYRPSADTSGTCTGGRWLNAGTGTCYNGRAQLISFSLPSVVPPSNAVLWTVQYNTRTHGYAPTGVSTGADSLNVAEDLIAAPYVGTNQYATTNYLYGSSAVAYCDTTGVFNTLRRDLDDGAGCLCPSAGSCYTPMARFNALDAVVVTE